MSCYSGYRFSDFLVDNIKDVRIIGKNGDEFTAIVNDELYSFTDRPIDKEADSNYIKYLIESITDVLEQCRKVG